MRKPFRRKIRSRTGQKEYDGLISLRIPMLRDALGETQRAADRRKAAIDARTSKAREWATKVLRNAGPPDTKPAHAMPDDIGEWPDAKIEEYFNTLPQPPVDVEAPTNGRELSLEWHARQILERIASLEAALANGDPQWLVLAGMELAEAWHHAVFTEKHELPAAVGLAQLACGPDGADGGRQGLSEEELADIQRQADAIRRLNPGWSNAKVAEAIKNKHGRAERTIRRYLEDQRKTPR